MKNFRILVVLLVAGVLFAPTVTMAKMAVRLQQNVVYVQEMDKDGTLRVANDEAYKINNKEIINKANALVGKQARVLFFNMVQKKICVDIAPIAAPPFEITQPAPAKINKPL